MIFCINITFKSYKQLKGIRFCLHLTTVEGQVITLLQTSTQYDLKENESKTITYEADLSALRPGQYCFTPELYSISEYGTRFSFIKVGMAVTFEIQKADDQSTEHESDNEKYGYVQFPELVVI